MRTTKELRAFFESGENDGLLKEIYIDEALLTYQRHRYVNAISRYEALYGCGEVQIYSAPGRSEIGGNHTDHQNGEVLAASVNLDVIGVVGKLDGAVKLVSDTAPEVEISIDDLEVKEEEKGSTKALIRGVLAGIRAHGGRLGGFKAYITSDVLIGAGLSSSAAFETLIGAIISGLYNEMELSPVDIAMIGQYAENEYFGKPCGLMDQTACSVGNMVHIDFADKKNPKIESVACDLEGYGYSLCITDTKGSHADLTDDYAAIPSEMRAAAAVFGKETLCGTALEELIANSDEVRKRAGDRALLRAVHFVTENARVKEEVLALRKGDFQDFLRVVKASGDSSFKYLQNVYVNRDAEHQNLSVALAVSEAVLGDMGVSRVHGGGFAGTIQAFVKKEAVAKYKKVMDKLFGDGACRVLQIRKYGGMKVL